MSDEDWEVGYAKSVGVFLNGQELSEVNERGGRVRDDSFLLLFNAGHEAVTFTLPDRAWRPCWLPFVDTASGGVRSGGPPMDAGAAAFVEARSLLVLQRVD